MNSIDWQPYLIGSTLRLRPLAEADYDALFAAASDPLIWEQHPDRERHTRTRFDFYFRSAIESKGALAVIDLKSGTLIGSSRYTDHNSNTSSVEIGFTFLTRNYWGGTYNRELKTLMLNYAFQQVETVYFVVGKNNLRSRKAMTKIGGIEIAEGTSVPVSGDLSKSVIYQIGKSAWASHRRDFPFAQPRLTTSRLALDAIDESHAEELCALFADRELHRFIPHEPLTLEKQRERCTRWAKRRSLDGTELWLNWIGREKTSAKVVGHFQAGVKEDGVASVGYVVAREFQRKGLAFEGMDAVFSYLRDTLGVREIKAWSDTRNEASHRLARKLGMAQVDFIKNADFFKGANSDEFVFSKTFAVRSEFDLTLERVDLSSAPLVQDILEAAPNYAMNTEGTPPSPTAAHDALIALPPNCRKEQKYVLLLRQSGVAIGVADLIRGWPEYSTALLGLMLLREDCQRGGRGRLFYGLLQEFAVGELGCQKIRLSVVDSNPVMAFWVKMGFKATGETFPHEGRSLKSIKRVMEKLL
jgi:RimJ/RimL family protein N-acetyltransferase